MKVDSQFKVSETAINTPPVQEITSLQITFSTKVTSSPVSSCPRITSDLTFKVSEAKRKEMSESSEKLKEPEKPAKSWIKSKTVQQLFTFWTKLLNFFFCFMPEVLNFREVEPESEPELTSAKKLNSSPMTRNSRPLSQLLKSSEVVKDSSPLKQMIKSSEVVVSRPLKFLVAEEVNGEALNENASKVSQLSASTPKRVFISQVPLVPIQHLSSVPLSTSSLSHETGNRRFSTHKTKVTTSLSMKPQFSGSCIIKSHQLRWKDRFLGTSWKKRRGKRIPHQSALKRNRTSSLTSALSQSSPSKTAAAWKFRQKKPPAHARKPLLKEFASWKRRKKKLARSSPLKEVAAWKRRKKKKSLAASLESSHIWKGSSLRKVSPGRGGRRGAARGGGSSASLIGIQALSMESPEVFPVSSSSCLFLSSSSLRQGGRNATTGCSSYSSSAQSHQPAPAQLQQCNIGDTF